MNTKHDMTFVVREAISNDMTEAGKIFLEAKKINMPWMPTLYTDEQVISFFQQVVFSQNQVHIAVSQNQVVGFIAFNDQWVQHLYVLPTHQSLGIGTSLLALAKKDATSLNLWTFQQNQQARDFYMKHGFQEVEFTDGENDEKLPDVRMVWTA